MASVVPTTPGGNPAYPTSDGKPMAETDRHRDLMLDLIQTLKDYFAAVTMVYVTGNLLLFYERGNKRRHVSPDVFVVKGVPNRERLNYLTWEEGRNPNVVMELTSSSTRHQDVTRKFRLYQDTLKVKEYFLFDPFGDYLKPPLQGYRLRSGQYHPIRPVAGRLPSRELGLHLEADGSDLRLYDPMTEQWLPTPQEKVFLAQEKALQEREKALRAEEQALRAEEQALRAEEKVLRTEEKLIQAEAENQRLLRELAELRRRLSQPP
jgi:Uma2 family endonuclease